LADAHSATRATVALSLTLVLGATEAAMPHLAIAAAETVTTIAIGIIAATAISATRAQWAASAIVVLQAHSAAQVIVAASEAHALAEVVLAEVAVARVAAALVAEDKSCFCRNSRQSPYIYIIM